MSMHLDMGKVAIDSTVATLTEADISSAPQEDREELRAKLAQVREREGQEVRKDVNERIKNQIDAQTSPAAGGGARASSNVFGVNSAAAEVSQDYAAYASGRGDILVDQDAKSLAMTYATGYQGGTAPEIDPNVTPDPNALQDDMANASLTAFDLFEDTRLDIDNDITVVEDQTVDLDERLALLTDLDRPLSFSLDVDTNLSQPIEQDLRQENGLTIDRAERLENAHAALLAAMNAVAEDHDTLLAERLQVAQAIEVEQVLVEEIEVIEVEEVLVEEIEVIEEVEEAVAWDEYAPPQDWTGPELEPSVLASAERSSSRPRPEPVNPNEERQKRQKQEDRFAEALATLQTELAEEIDQA